jgi:class 3 adenylate cyclase
MGVDVGAWLRMLGLQQYAQAFRDNDVDADLLARLTAEDLRELGVASVGHRRRLLDATAALQVAAAPPLVAPAVGASGGARLAEPSQAGAERRQLTVMFVDLVGSTGLAGRLDPEDLRAAIRTYQDACAGVVARFEGFVAKCLGDGVLA